jgi:hypothetical protein
MRRGQRRLECGISLDQCGIPAQCVAKDEAVVPGPAAGNRDVKAVRPMPLAPAYQPFAIGQRRVDFG